jgi:IS1 family transposase/transposase-like protein
MLRCPYCGCQSLVKNGSTRGVPKWKCKTCRRQTSLRGNRAADAAARDRNRLEATLLYLCGLSLNVIAFLKGVVPSTILNWVRHCARRWAAKPQPGAEGVLVMELDEVWHFVGRKARKVWIWLAFCRDTGQLVDWQCGPRDQETLDQLLERLTAWNVQLYCTDSYICYDQALPVGRHFMGKEETWRLEQIHSRLRHWLARFRRRTVVVSKSIEMVDLSIALFARFRINGSVNDMVELAT